MEAVSLYLHVARQYFSPVFYPAYCYSETTVQVTIEGGLFVNTKARQDKSRAGSNSLPAKSQMAVRQWRSTEESAGKDDEENDEFIGQRL